jgi:hypothetical protein
LARLVCMRVTEVVTGCNSGSSYNSLQPVDNSPEAHREWRACIVHILSEIVVFVLVTGFWGDASKACVVKATVGSNPTLSAKYLAQSGLKT